MIFYDSLYGRVDLRSPLLRDLLRAPEFQRLRWVRMPNVDAPSVKDFATASRFAHTIGVCYLADWLGRHRSLPKLDIDLLVAAAVLHDMGIPPFGHLVEQMIDELNPPFNHELLARQIIEGTYAPENKYHQIAPGRTIKVGEILDRHGIDRELVYQALGLNHGPSVLSGPVDIDNIDNVLRMAQLLGLGNFSDVAYGLLRTADIDSNGALVVSSDSLPHLIEWLRLRAASYNAMQYTPDAIAYSALVYDLITLAVQEGIVGKHNWFITDSMLIELLTSNPRTSELAEQLLWGIRYECVASVRVEFDPSAGAVLGAARRGMFVRELQAEINSEYSQSFGAFAWYEFAKVTRAVPMSPKLGPRIGVLGENSSSALVALVQKRPNRNVGGTWHRDFVAHWAQLVEQAARGFGPVRSVCDVDAGPKCGNVTGARQLQLL